MVTTAEGAPVLAVGGGRMTSDWATAGGDRRPVAHATGSSDVTPPGLGGVGGDRDLWLTPQARAMPPLPGAGEVMLPVWRTPQARRMSPLPGLVQWRGDLGHGDRSRFRLSRSPGCAWQRGVPAWSACAERLHPQSSIQHPEKFQFLGSRIDLFWRYHTAGGTLCPQYWRTLTFFTGLEAAPVASRREVVR